MLSGAPVVSHPSYILLPTCHLQDVVTLPCVGHGRYLSVQKRVTAANWGDDIGGEGCTDDGVLHMAEVQVLGHV